MQFKLSGVLKRLALHKWLMVIPILIIFASCVNPRSNKPSQKFPNILFILADDQRYDVIHALGNKEIITPNLDALISSGTTFINSYIMGAMNGAVCAPSRAMLITGRTLFEINPYSKARRLFTLFLDKNIFKTYL